LLYFIERLASKEPGFDLVPDHATGAIDRVGRGQIGPSAAGNCITLDGRGSQVAGGLCDQRIFPLLETGSPDVVLFRSRPPPIRSSKWAKGAVVDARFG
jgi:hypothetical protein